MSTQDSPSPAKVGLTKGHLGHPNHQELGPWQGCGLFRRSAHRPPALFCLEIRVGGWMGQMETPPSPPLVVWQVWLIVILVIPPQAPVLPVLSRIIPRDGGSGSAEDQPAHYSKGERATRRTGLDRTGARPWRPERLDSVAAVAHGQTGSLLHGYCPDLFIRPVEVTFQTSRYRYRLVAPLRTRADGHPRVCLQYLPTSNERHGTPNR
ncbi:hypothetical protein F4780DRAFT_376799 [Xylariomycetidae sp. FL0641]|nr:hypothetical protein F4780DRAFT_376799 [Xylariomycetidae sp. FL0641]